MEYGQINKDTIRAMLEQTPNTQENQALIASMVKLLTSKTIEPVPYTYSAVWWLTGANNAIANGAANLPYNINIQADADFLLLNQTFMANSANATLTAATNVLPNVIITMTDTGSGAAMMDQAVPVPAVFGDGRQPYVLPQPKLLLAKATLQILATNIDAAAAYNLRLCFNGVKLYAYN